MCVSFSDLQRAHDRAHHPEFIINKGFRIERNKPGTQSFRAIIGPEGETLTVRASGIYHVFIEQDGIDSCLDEIMIECLFDIAWQAIKQAAEDGLESLILLLNDIEKRGAKALL